MAYPKSREQPRAALPVSYGYPEPVSWAPHPNVYSPGNATHPLLNTHWDYFYVLF